MPPGCSQLDSICWHIIIPIFWAPTLILSIGFLYLYITAYLKNAIKTSKLMFYVGIAFLVSITLTCISAIIRAESYCHRTVFSSRFLQLYVVFYALQASLLTATLFLRLALIFKDSEFKLAKRSIYAYVVICVVSLIIMLLYLTSRVTFQSANFEAVLVAVSFLIYLGTLFWINYLFIARLLRVYESCKDTAVKNVRLKQVATKNAILCVVSSSTILVFAMCEILRIQVPSIYTVMLDFFCLQCDLITNMLSILLGYRHFDACYSRLCGCCHHACSALCDRNKNKNEEMIVIQSAADSSDFQTATSQTEL